MKWGEGWPRAKGFLYIYGSSPPQNNVTLAKASLKSHPLLPGKTLDRFQNFSDSSCARLEDESCPKRIEKKNNLWY